MELRGIEPRSESLQSFDSTCVAAVTAAESCCPLVFPRIRRADWAGATPGWVSPRQLRRSASLVRRRAKTFGPLSSPDQGNRSRGCEHRGRLDVVVGGCGFSLGFTSTASCSARISGRLCPRRIQFSPVHCFLQATAIGARAEHPVGAPNAGSCGPPHRRPHHLARRCRLHFSHWPVLSNTHSS